MKIRRHRRFASSAVLGAWIFALFVGAVHACGWVDASAPATHADVAPHAGLLHDSGPGVECVEHPGEGLPVLNKVQAVQDPPEGRPLVVGPGHGVARRPSSAPALRSLRAARPPPAAPPLLRFLRLTL